MKRGKTERVVLVIRHAKAEDGTGDDHARRLTGKGLRQTSEAATWLRDEGIEPDCWWASTAARTVQTAQELMGLSAPPLSQIGDLYEASAHSVINQIASAPSDCATLAVVGHQPAVSSVVAALTDRHLNYPPCTIVAVGFDGAWSDISQGCGRVLATFRPT